LERTEVDCTLSSADRGFVDDIGTYEERGRVALSTKNETNVGHSSGHFYDNVTPLAVIDTTKESYRIDLRGQRQGPFEGIKVIRDHKPVVLSPLLFQSQDLMEPRITLKDTVGALRIIVPDPALAYNHIQSIECGIMGCSKRKTDNISLGAAIILLEKGAKTGVEFPVKRSRPVAQIANEGGMILQFLDNVCVRHFRVELFIGHNSQDIPFFTGHEFNLPCCFGMGSLYAVVIDFESS
jgi:hypothetical protein